MKVEAIEGTGKIYDEPSVRIPSRRHAKKCVAIRRHGLHESSSISTRIGV
ncbi:SKP1-like protein [Corchorus olitorius]|uniref:SKP1-like protein n=1 Tax=Corchorus olitorius TaxID=93759 RepID=A0A1R3G9Z7_9ROSI|nr:SKP1-like protein [Corchorus olitorius]